MSLSLYTTINKGKGGALKSGFEAITGNIVVIQDADLEYNPEDLKEMLKFIIENKVDVVYGSRFHKKYNKSFSLHYAGNKLITYIFNLLFGMKFSDIETCYKMFKIEILEKIRPFECNDFGFEIEITAKISKLAKKEDIKIIEVPVTYRRRGYNEGKKLNWKDMLKVWWYILKFRFF